MYMCTLVLRYYGNWFNYSHFLFDCLLIFWYVLTIWNKCDNNDIFKEGYKRHWAFRIESENRKMFYIRRIFFLLAYLVFIFLDRGEWSKARSEKAWFEFWFQHFLTWRGLPSYLHTVCLSFLILTKGFLDGSAGRESTCSVGDPIPGLGRAPGKRNGHPPQYSGLENSMYSPWDRKESDTTERL